MKKRFRPGHNAGTAKGIIEQGAVIKKGKGLIKAGLVYPNTYKAGMSSLGFQTVYRIANDIDNVACERVFLGTGKPSGHGPKSLETGLTLAQFDIILFSISFENDFFHLVQLLKEAGIPLRSSDRNHTHPLVVAGGVACFLNPEPIAPFMDLFLLGEAECLLENFFIEYQQEPVRKSFLQVIEKNLPGAYVPAAHIDNDPFKIKVQYLNDLESITTTTSILSSGAAFKETFLIETLKGCPHGCRFCSAGFIYRPPRIYPVENIYSAMDTIKGKTDRIGLVSSAIADHPDINDICRYGHSKGFRLSFSSLRADMLSDDLLLSLTGSKIKTATIAPEAGSERMRRVINKRITKDQILDTTRRLVDAGILNLRLYFMIGLPFETHGDIEAIVALVKKIKSVYLTASRKNKKIGTLTLSINPFIPKPATPFQWAAMADKKTLKHRVDIIRNGLKKIANVTIKVESLKKAGIHALLSRGGRKTADIIESAVDKGWPSALKQHKAYVDTIVFLEKPMDALLPWDFLNNRVKKEFLVKEFSNAKQEKNSPPCPMKDCKTCRICIR